MNVSHMGSDSVRVKVTWLVAVNVYGNSPMKLFVMTNMNMEMNVSVIPALRGCLIRIENS